MKQFWRLLGYLRDYKGLVALGIASNLLTAVFTTLSIPLLIPFLDILFDQTALVTEPPGSISSVDQVSQWANYHLSQLIIEQGKQGALTWVCVLILIVFFFKNVFRYLAMFFLAPVRNGIVHDLRSALYDKVLALPLSFYSEERKGDIMSRLASDVQEVELSILNVLEIIFREPLIIMGSLAFMLYLSPSLTLFVFVLIIFTALVIGGIGRSLRKSSQEVQSRMGNLLSMIEETLSGLRIIKGFNAEAYQGKKFKAENKSYLRVLTRLIWRRDLASPLSEFLGIMTVAILLWYGSSLVFSGEIEASVFLTFIFAFYNVIDPAKKFSKAQYNIQKGIAALDRIDELRDAPVAIADKPGALSLGGFDQSIRFDEVCFAYNPADGLVLDRVALHIPKGKIVALVGESGGGKSTLVDLLPRFYDVTSGRILIDGHDIRDIKIADLRALMGMVSQEPILFNDTIYNNIVFGKEGVGEEDVVRAAKVAHAHEFIMSTESGYQTNIGDRGTKLSGGQRQRLTIARAVLRDPPILILDEATSALDSESEKLVQQALLSLMQNRTSIVIAHRLSTIQHADEIVVMQNGRIIERGTHEELLHQTGAYRKLVELQAF